MPHGCDQGHFHVTREAAERCDDAARRQRQGWPDDCDCGHGWHLHSSAGCMAMRGRERCECRRVQGLPRLGSIPKVKRSPHDSEA